MTKKSIRGLFLAFFSTPNIPQLIEIKRLNVTADKILTALLVSAKLTETLHCLRKFHHKQAIYFLCFGSHL